jgi:hypothetical protein
MLLSASRSCFKIDIFGLVGVAHHMTEVESEDVRARGLIISPVISRVINHGGSGNF